jgi:tetratricopeptide (TPR) repeat protein
MAYRLNKFASRNRALLTGIAAVLAVLVAGVAVSMILALREFRARREAERYANISQAVKKFNEGLLLSFYRYSRSWGTEPNICSILDVASTNVDSEFVDEPLMEASIRSSLGSAYLGVGEHKKAEPHLERALRIRREQLGEQHLFTMESKHYLAETYCEQHRYKNAESLLLDVVEVRRLRLGHECPETLKSITKLIQLYEAWGKPERAVQWLENWLVRKK